MSYLNLDLKSNQPIKPRRRFNRPKIHFNHLIRGITALATLVASVYFLMNLLPDSIARVDDSNLKEDRIHYSIPLPTPIESESVDLADPIEEYQIATDARWNTVKIKSGDTLASIFSNAGLKPIVTHTIANLNQQTGVLKKIKPGQTIALNINQQGDLVNLKYQPDITQTLVIKRLQGDTYESELQHHPLEPIPVFKTGIIETSLFEAAADNNIPDNIIMELAGIFGWDIDFALDIRKGDSFRVVYNELYKDGIKIRNGRILAAEFVNQGNTFQAVYYTDPKGDSGYYAPDGKSMRKAFLRSPVRFSRISSGFSRKRWHPVLSKWRSHKGVDYAAPKGTPVRSAGDGKITFQGTKGGYGKSVIIQHGGRYTTVYAHLSRYARGMKNGKRVKQGQVIGYVGKTGLATGPHLHYEFRVDGAHRNPLTVQLPAAEPIDKAYKPHFAEKTRPFLSMLELMATETLAQTGN
jgi:murein DD-endopeptidase MepM/ murein hydrolase activator NlpD